MLDIGLNFNWGIDIKKSKGSMMAFAWIQVRDRKFTRISFKYSIEHNALNFYTSRRIV